MRSPCESLDAELEVPASPVVLGMDRVVQADEDGGEPSVHEGQPADPVVARQQEGHWLERYDGHLASRATLRSRRS